MVNIGVLKGLPWHDDSPWASPTFGIPRKTGNIRIITDFKELNKLVEVDPFLLPRINETLQKLERFKPAIALDLSLSFILFHLMKRVRKYAIQSYHGDNITTYIDQWVYCALCQCSS